MATLNVVVLVGNLTADPELRYTQNGTARTRFSVALNRRWKDREGNLKEETTFVPVVVWGQQAENCANYLRKGRAVAVNGRLSIRRYTTDEGEERRVTEVVAQNVQFLGGGPRQEQQQEQEPAEPEGGESEPEPIGTDEEIPF